MKRINSILALLLIFLVSTTAYGLGGKRQTVQISTLSNDANGCFEDQTTSGAATLLLNGVLATGTPAICRFASAQQISIEGTGTNAGVVAAIIGLGADGRDERENLTLVNAGTAKSVRYYIQIKSIDVDGAVDGNIEAGPLSTNGAVSASILPDLASYSALMSISVGITGTLTATIEHTSNRTPSTIEQRWFSTLDLTGLTADAEGNIVASVAGIRAKITSYTSGTLNLVILQELKR